MRLIDDWHQAWKWFSMQFVAAAGALQVALLSFPEVLRAYVPNNVMHIMVLVLLAAAVVGRLVDQSPGKK